MTKKILLLNAHKQDTELHNEKVTSKKDCGPPPKKKIINIESHTKGNTGQKEMMKN